MGGEGERRMKRRRKGEGGGKRKKKEEGEVKNGREGRPGEGSEQTQFNIEVKHTSVYRE